MEGTGLRVICQCALYYYLVNFDASQMTQMYSEASISSETALQVADTYGQNLRLPA